MLAYAATEVSDAPLLRELLGNDIANGVGLRNVYIRMTDNFEVFKVTDQDVDDGISGNQHFNQGLALRHWASGIREFPPRPELACQQGASVYDRFYMDPDCWSPLTVWFSTIKTKRRGYVFYSDHPHVCTNVDRSKAELRTREPGTFRAEQQLMEGIAAEYGDPRSHSNLEPHGLVPPGLVPPVIETAEPPHPEPEVKHREAVTAPSKRRPGSHRFGFQTSYVIHNIPHAHLLRAMTPSGAARIGLRVAGSNALRQEIMGEASAAGVRRIDGVKIRLFEEDGEEQGVRLQLSCDWERLDRIAQTHVQRFLEDIVNRWNAGNRYGAPRARFESERGVSSDIRNKMGLHDLSVGGRQQ